MNYQTAILILLLFCVSIYIIVSLYQLEKTLVYSTNLINDTASKNATLTQNHINNGLVLCTNRIKTINNDLIEQIRTMNDFGNQPINIVSNCFTDSDNTENHNQPVIQYLSDVRVQSQPNNVNICEQKLTPTNNSKLSRQLYISSESKNDNQKNSDYYKINITTENNDKADVKQESDKKTDNKIENNVKSESDKKTDNKIENNVKSESEKELDNNHDANSSQETNSKSNHSDGIKIEITSKKSSKSNHSLTINDLKSINSYTIETIKELGKSLAIPLTIKENGSARRNLKKDEIYNKIKSYLISKK